MSEKHEATIWLEQYFEKLRKSKEWNLGNGDIRLTPGQQEQIIDIVNIICERDSDRFCGGSE